MSHNPSHHNGAGSREHFPHQRFRLLSHHFHHSGAFSPSHRQVPSVPNRKLTRSSPAGCKIPMQEPQWRPMMPPARKKDCKRKKKINHMLFFISTLHAHFLLSFDHRNVRKNIGTGNLIINKKTASCHTGSHSFPSDHQASPDSVLPAHSTASHHARVHFSRLSFCLRLVVSESLSNPLKKHCRYIQTAEGTDRNSEVVPLFSVIKPFLFFFLHIAYLLKS